MTRYRKQLRDIEVDQYSFVAVTDGLIVVVCPVFEEEQSNPDQARYVWSYHVTIESMRKKPCQLLSRQWIITDSQAHIIEVEGEGVIGLQPVFNNGDVFRYSSVVPLSNPSGFMRGCYIFETADGEMLEVEIPTFSLDSPYIPMTRQ
jgi:ApaG protein